MEDKEIYDPEPSFEYCEIVKIYQKCLKEVSKNCRGNLNYHGTVHGIDRVSDIHCKPKSSNSGNSSNNRISSRNGVSPTTPKLIVPSCRYFGSFKFRHCGLYGDPHLKTFNGMYQTCSVSGTWTLIDNSYMSVQVTSAPVAPGSHATAPVKVRLARFTFFLFFCITTIISIEAKIV